MTARTHVLPTAVLVGAAMLGFASQARAWIDLEFISDTPSPQVVMTCSGANYQPACATFGIRRGWTWWNPLDGDRWSNYHLQLQHRVADIRLYDTRQGCSVGSGAGRGWSWIVSVSSNHRDYTHHREVCSGGGGWTEQMQIYVREAQHGYVFEVRGNAHDRGRPGARFHYDMRSYSITPMAYP